MSVQKVSGRAGTFTYNGTKHTITSWKGKITRELADSTGSDNYDATSDMIWKAQLPNSVQVEADVEGFFDLNSTQTLLITQVTTSAAPVNVILGISSTVNFGHGLMDIGDFECDMEVVDENVKFTCTIKSNGVFTTGS